MHTDSVRHTQTSTRMSYDLITHLTSLQSVSSCKNTNVVSIFSTLSIHSFIHHSGIYSSLYSFFFFFLELHLPCPPYSPTPPSLVHSTPSTILLGPSCGTSTYLKHVISTLYQNNLPLHLANKCGHIFFPFFFKPLFLFFCAPIPP